MHRIRVQKSCRRTDSRVASVETQPPLMDSRDLDVVRAKAVQRERKC
jgi:hypothetical protein